MNERVPMKKGVYAKKHINNLYSLRQKIVFFFGSDEIRNCSIIFNSNKNQTDDSNLIVGGFGLPNVSKLPVTCGVFLALLSYKFLEL